MSATDPRKYDMSLDDLVKSVRVPVADQVSAADDPAAVAPEPDVDQVNTIRWSAG